MIRTAVAVDDDSGLAQLKSERMKTRNAKSVERNQNTNRVSHGTALVPSKGAGLNSAILRVGDIEMSGKDHLPSAAEIIRAGAIPKMVLAD